MMKVNWKSTCAFPFCGGRENWAKLTFSTARVFGTFDAKHQPRFFAGGMLNPKRVTPYKVNSSLTLFHFLPSFSIEVAVGVD